MIWFHLRVKFRAFGITFGTVEQRGSHQLIPTLPIPLPAVDRTIYNERGIFLRLATTPIP